nr:hypothetical protein [Desulfobulbaceae bacterium]
MRIDKLAATIFIVAITITSCGYYNPYVVSSNSKPITLHRSMWANQTNELGLETTFYNSLSDWLRKTKLITLTENVTDAEFILTGKINSVDYPEISYSSNNIANELRANLTVTFSIKEQATGKTVWEKSGYTLQETLSKVSDPTQLLASKKVALAEISDNLAEEIYLYIINSIMRPDGNMELEMQMNTEIK